MHFWFQNLNKEHRKKRLFYFRGSVGRAWDKVWFKYELSSGPALRLQYDHGDGGDAESQLSLGLLFFTLYLTFFLPKRFYFHEKHVATWDNNREFTTVDARTYGFYLYDWAIVWRFHAKPDESNSKDPWWMHQYIHLDDIFLGRRDRCDDALTKAENVEFWLGDKKFVMNKITWTRWRFFRRHIPYSLYHRTIINVNMEIKDPPVHQGKGENSWDCGDDGTYGISRPWEYELPNWSNRDAMARKAIEVYVEHVARDVKRYGTSKSERGVSKDEIYKLRFEP